VIFIRSGVMPAAGDVAQAFGSPKAVGEVLFNEYLLPFEITSVLLLVAIVGAIVLTMRRRTGRKYMEMEQKNGAD
jgi:NADH-quinone oxidoreductase subunit J